MPKGALDLATIYPDSTLEGTYVGLIRIFGLGGIAGSQAIAGGVLFIGDGTGRLNALA